MPAGEVMVFDLRNGVGLLRPIGAQLLVVRGAPSRG